MLRAEIYGIPRPDYATDAAKVGGAMRKEQTRPFAFPCVLA